MRACLSALTHEKRWAKRNDPSESGHPAAPVIPPDTTVDGKVLCSGNDQGGKGFPRPTPGASTYSIGAVETKAVETKKVISAHASVRECHLSKQGFALKGRLARTAAGTGSGALRLLMRLPKNR